GEDSARRSGLEPSLAPRLRPPWAGFRESSRCSFRRVVIRFGLARAFHPAEKRRASKKTLDNAEDLGRDTPGKWLPSTVPRKGSSLIEDLPRRYRFEGNNRWVERLA